MPEMRLELHGKLGAGKYALVDGDYDGEYFSQWRWYVNDIGYVFRFDKSANRTVYLHHEVCARPPKGFVRDHINRDKLDNRTCNLRWASYTLNAQNRNTTKIRAASGYIGVSRASSQSATGKPFISKNKWVTTFRSKYVGSFDSPEEASEAYQSSKADFLATLA